jgi:dihydrofolate reductase
MTNTPINQIIQLVVIADENNGIGKDNELLAKMPEDLKHFKKLTTGFPVIMGRKTFNSVGNRPLPNRRNIVVTRQSLSFEGAEIAHSLEDALKLCRADEKISIVGGETIFRQAMPLANVIELTRLHHTFPADTFFPEIDPTQWQQTASEEHPADSKNPYPFTFLSFSKIGRQ